MKDDIQALGGEELQKKKMTLRYMVALGLIALLSVGSFIMNQREIASQAKYAELINLAGRQRALIQSVVRDLLASKVGFVSAKEKAAENFHQWKEVQSKLLSGEYFFTMEGISFEGASTRLKEIEPARLHLQESLYRWLDGKTPDGVRLQEVMVAVDTYVASMDALLYFFEDEVARHVDEHYRGELYILISYFILFGFIVFLVFRPMVHDIREVYERLVQSNRKLKESGEYLKKAQSIAHMGYWTWEPTSNRFEWSDEISHILGYDPQKVQPSFENFMKAVHPEDRTLVAEAIERSFADSKNSFNLEHRIVCPNKVERVVHEQGEITYDENGKPVRMLGTVRDITEQVKAVEELELYRMMIEKSADPVFLIDDDDNCKMIFVNEAAVKHFGYPKEKILEWRIPDWDPNFTHEKLSEHVEEIKKVRNLMIESTHRTKDGNVPVEISLNMIYYKGHLCHFGYFKNISERKIAQDELLEAKEAAEAANRTKGEFLANMSHEIRTPMNAILGFTEILQGMVTDEMQKEYIRSISTSGKTLLTLINDILDLSKVEAGKLNIEKSVVNPHTIFNDMKLTFSQKVKEKEIDFIIDIDPGLPEAVMLDEIRLRQVLLNLIGNAVKFTDKGHVQVSVTSGGTLKGDKLINLIFAVEDTGVGIPEEQVQSIFSPFTQKKGQNYTQYGGTGLGLSITRKLVSLMDGELDVISQVGQGSTFYVRLGEIEICKKKIKKEEPATGLVEFEPAKILVVDDIKENRDLIRGFLASFDFTVQEAQNGQEGIDMALEMLPDLILMDMRMPVMDGYSTINEIRSIPELAKIPVVAVTASAMGQTDDEIIRISDGYLRKPFTKKQLVEMMGKFLPYRMAGLKEPAEPEEKKREIIEYTHEVLQRLPEMVSKIESELMPQWEEINEMIIMDDIRDFCQKNRQLAENYSYPPLLEWCTQLEKYCNLYDTGEIRRVLQEYPKEVKKTKELINEHGA